MSTEDTDKTVKAVGTDILLLKLAALSHFGLVVAGLLMPRVVGLGVHLRGLPDFIRKLVWVYSGFIGLCLTSFGEGAFVFAADLASGTPPARAVCGFPALFWARRSCRFGVRLRPPPLSHQQAAARGTRSGEHRLRVSACRLRMDGFERRNRMTKDNRRIVLAGGSGFLGGLLARYFSTRNWDVVVLARGASTSRDSFQPAQPASSSGMERLQAPERGNWMERTYW